jgi:hypothetical protein
MTEPASPPRKPSPTERRSGSDRRKVDKLPPGKVDRRRSVDSRKPDVVELDMSNSEWTALTQVPEPPPKGR